MNILTVGYVFNFDHYRSSQLSNDTIYLVPVHSNDVTAIKFSTDYDAAVAFDRLQNVLVANGPVADFTRMDIVQVYEESRSTYFKEKAA